MVKTDWPPGGVGIRHLIEETETETAGPAGQTEQQQQAERAERAENDKGSTRLEPEPAHPLAPSSGILVRPGRAAGPRGATAHSLKLVIGSGSQGTRLGFYMNIRPRTHRNIFFSLG